MKTYTSYVPSWATSITIPTYITLLRLALVPFIVMSLSAHNSAWGAFLFLIAALTDVIDGALARALKAESQLGAFLDPLADKVLLIGCYAGLAYSYFPFTLIPGWFLIVVTVQEFIMIAGALYLTVVKKEDNVQPTALGKLSSFGQLLFIGWLIVCGWLQNVSMVLFSVLLMLTLTVRICTFIQYTARAFHKEL